MNNKIEFIAEIKLTKQVKKASLDNEYSILLVTDDPQLMELGKIPSDVVVKVSIEPNGQ